MARLQCLFCYSARNVLIKWRSRKLRRISGLRVACTTAALHGWTRSPVPLYKPGYSETSPDWHVLYPWMDTGGMLGRRTGTRYGGVVRCQGSVEVVDRSGNAEGAIADTVLRWVCPKRRCRVHGMARVRSRACGWRITYRSPRCLQWNPGLHSGARFLQEYSVSGMR